MSPAFLHQAVTTGLSRRQLHGWLYSRLPEEEAGRSLSTAKLFCPDRQNDILFQQDVEISDMITITESARIYLKELLDKQEDALGVRVFINNPGTPRAETCIAYCREGDKQASDEAFDFELFQAWIEARSLPFLEDAVVDYAKDKMGGQLTIKAPNAKMPRVDADSPIEDRINYVLYNEVNPSLASHGGDVSLVEVTDENVAILRFGGGCQGCSAVSITLKDGVEKTLIEQIPELAGVRDMTDHTDRSKAYY